MDDIGTHIYIALFKAFLKQNPNVDENEAAINMIGILLKRKQNKYKDSFCVLLHLIFNNATSQKIKENVVKMVRINKLTAKFKNMLNEEEENEFISLVK